MLLPGALRIAQRWPVMRTRTVRLRYLALSLAGMGLLGPTGCQSPALLRTARTLPPGTSDWSVSFNLTHLSTNVAGVPEPLEKVVSSSFNYPNPVPELLYSHGISPELEIGGRLSLGSGLVELDTKFRYLEADQGRLHAALAPAFGYRALGIVNGPVVTLPALVTYELSPSWAVSGGVLASYAAYRVAAGLNDEQADLSGNTLYVGGGAGLELRRGRFHLMPALELQRSVSRTGAAAQAPDIGLLFLSLSIGIGPPEPSAPGRPQPSARETEARAP
jgi:hypothetical protein